MRKRIITGIAILLSYGAVNAQALKEKRKIVFENTELIYSVNDKNEKNGPVFIKETKKDKTYLKGQNISDKPSGKWYFYNEDGTVESHYNFDLTKLLYIDSAYLKKIDVAILDKDPEIIANSTIPILLYPSHLLLKLIANDVQIPDADFGGRNQLPIKLMVIIQANGETEYYIEYAVGNLYTKKKVVLTTKFLDNIWIPSHYKNKNVKSSFTINTSINSDYKAGHRKFTWTY
jgi:phenylpyruvate tautomerase PptA (4-oxalocrotonate tautomerase family)